MGNDTSADSAHVASSSAAGGDSAATRDGDEAVVVPAVQSTSGLVSVQGHEPDPERNAESTVDVTEVPTTTIPDPQPDVSSPASSPGASNASETPLAPKPTEAMSKVEQEIIMLINAHEGKKVLMGQLPDKYKSAYSTPIPYKELGCKKLKDLLVLLPSLSLPDAPSGYEYVCRCDGQVQDTDAGMGEKRKWIPPHLSDGGGSVSEGSTAGSERARQESEVSGMYQDALAHHPLAHRPQFTQILNVEHMILALIDKSEDAKISLCDLQARFQTAYSTPIFYRECGYPKLKGLLSEIPSISVCGRGGGKQLYVCRTVNTSGVTDDLVSLIKDASKGLVSTRMHKQILDLLAENPDGVTCSRVLGGVKGLPYYIQSRAKEAGRDFFSPAVVLHHCEGVIGKKLDGRNLFFPDADYVLPNGKKEPANEGTKVGSNSNTADGLAAIEFLSLLHNEFQGRPWPASKRQLKQFLSGMDTQTAPRLMTWVEQGTEDEVTPSKKRKEALKRLMLQLRRMDCMSGTNNSLSWNLTVVGKNVDQNHGSDCQLPIGSDDAVPLHDSVTTARGSTAVKLIETHEQLATVKLLSPFNPAISVNPDDRVVVAIDCEGVPENIFLIQVGTCEATYVFDCVKLGAAEVCEALVPLLMDPCITKLFHDLHNDAVAFAQIGVEPLRGTLDTQLAVESLTGDLHIGFNQMLQQFGRDGHPLKKSVKQRMDDGRLFAQRPLPPDVLKYATLDVSLLIGAKDSLFKALGNTRDCVQRASDTRAELAPRTGGARQICFDIENSYSMASFELLQEQRPGDMLVPIPLEVSDDTGVLMEMLPEDLREALVGKNQVLSDVVLDKGRTPLAWVNGERLFLGDENRVVSPEDIGAIVERLGGFGTDNRAGLERQLHRISAMRNRQSDIVGLTMRVGRHVTGNATIISDLLFNDCTKSVLFLGEPGSGKTTVVREVTRLLAERFNVCIVDTSNEIAGDGDVPHPCVGFARRMMVPSLDKQSDVMIECVQNHTPEVMVIDEIGRSTEVEAARTCKQRGVRLIASAHGDLRKLIKNPKLRGLIGGVETVTLGDAQAKLESKKAGKPDGGVQKLKAQRAGSPTFDVIVELRRGAHHEWVIVMDAGDAVDRVLEGQHYLLQRRTRDPLSGTLTLHLDTA